MERFISSMDIYEAVKENNQSTVRLLVERGIDKEKTDGIGCTPLWWSSAKGYLELTQYLVEQGAVLDKANIIGTTPLSVAAAKGHLEVCRYLLEQGADRDKADDSTGYTPLHRAVCNGRLDIAMLLMRYGADLNARTMGGWLPIEMSGRNTEEIKQAIRDEPRRRMDEAPGKRATEQDRHPNAATTASAQQEKEEVEEQSNKRPRLGDEGAAEVAEDQTKVAEEDEDSEPSSDENDD